MGDHLIELAVKANSGIEARTAVARGLGGHRSDGLDTQRSEQRRQGFVRTGRPVSVAADDEPKTLGYIQ